MKLTQPIIQQRINAFKDRCRQEGLSLTHQRLAVYSRLAATLEHPTAEELYEGIHSEYPMVSLGTVYKTLETFEEHGFITKSRSTGERARYDANLEPHHHLVCKVCGRMEDILEEALGALIQRSQAPDKAVPGTGSSNPLNISKQVRPGFLVEEVRIDFRGICGPCRVKTKAGVKIR